MAFNRPTLNDLVTRIQSDLEARMGASGKVLRRSVISVLARVLAGVAHLIYGFLDWIFKQVFPDTAESENLDRWATIWGVTRKTATYAQGNTVFTGSSNGVVIPAGTLVQRSDGVQFTTDANATIASGTATAAITCATPGAVGDTNPSTVLTLVAPIATVTSQSTVDSSGLIGGADQETDPELLARLLARIQTPPNGGAINDYIAWAEEVAGVTRAWAYANYMAPNGVGVTFVKDDATPSIIPSGGDVAAVLAYITDPSRAPVNASITVFAPIADTLNFTIALTPNTAAAKAAVQAELADLVRRESSPGGTIPLSHIREAISIASGVTDYTMSSPSADVVSSAGHIATMGTITWA